MPQKKTVGVSGPDLAHPDDAPELTEEFFADAEVFQGDTFVRRGRGRPSTGNARELISVRLDRDVLAKLREAGPGWQSQINSLLRTALQLDGELHNAEPVAVKAVGVPVARVAVQVRQEKVVSAGAVEVTTVRNPLAGSARVRVGGR